MVLSFVGTIQSSLVIPKNPMDATQFFVIILTIFLAQSSSEDKPYLLRMAKFSGALAVISLVINIVRGASIRLL